MKKTTIKGKDGQKVQIKIKDSSVYFAYSTTYQKLTILQHNKSESQLKTINEYFNLLKNKKDINQEVSFKFYLNKKNQMLSKNTLQNIAEIMNDLTKEQQEILKGQNLTIEEHNKMQFEENLFDLKKQYQKKVQENQKNSLDISGIVKELQRKQNERELSWDQENQFSSSGTETTYIKSLTDQAQKYYVGDSNFQARNWSLLQKTFEIPKSRQKMSFLQSYEESKVKAIKTFGFFIIIKEQKQINKIQWSLNMQVMFPTRAFIQTQVYPIFTQINWEHLKELNMSNCGIYDNALELILTEVKFPNLEILHLRQNYLENLPNNFQVISKVKILHLRDNFLHRFYKKINYLQNVFQSCNLLSQNALIKLIGIKWQNLQKLSLSFPGKKNAFMQNLNLWEKFIQNKFINFPSLKEICVQTSQIVKSSQNNVQQVINLLKQASKKYTNDKIIISSQLVVIPVPTQATNSANSPFSSSEKK